APTALSSSNLGATQPECCEPQLNQQQVRHPARKAEKVRNAPVRKPRKGEARSVAHGAACLISDGQTPCTPRTPHSPPAPTPAPADRAPAAPFVCPPAPQTGLQRHCAGRRRRAL